MKKYDWEVSANALEKWTPLAKKEEKYAFNIFGVIGSGYGEIPESNAKNLAVFLQNADGKDVTININSPGGDMFEGVAMYNMLKDYEGGVSVKVFGIAASAASIIAMAGDDIYIPASGFLMIHNCWSVVMGNSEDLLEASKVFSKFDDSMTKIYVSKTGVDEKKIKKMMADETYLTGEESIKMNFVTGYLEETAEAKENKNISALKRIDTAMAKGGLTRKERRELLKEIHDTQNAVNEATQNASEDEEKLSYALLRLNMKMKQINKGD